MEFPALHLSQAVLVNGKSAKLTVKPSKDQDEIVISILNQDRNSSSIDCYINAMQSSLQITLTGKGAEVHLSGHFEQEGNPEENDMFYGAENDDDDDDSEDEDPKKAAVKSALV